MAIKNLFGRGIGFTGGLIKWVVTRGFSIGASGNAPNVGIGGLYIECAFSGDAGLMEAAASAIAIEPADDGGITVLP